ncbi:MAG: carbohydrate ABC transporter permease, partial [Bacillota bacterium]
MEQKTNNNQQKKLISYKNKLIPYLFLIPSGIFLITFTYYPIFRSFYLSFYENNLWMTEPEFVGFQNFRYLFEDSLFKKIILNNLFYLAGTIPVIIVLSLFIAILINERSRFREFYEASIFTPTLVPMAAAAMLWVFIYNPDIGILNKVLRSLGISGKAWINSSDTALPSLMMVMIWKNLGYFVILFLAGLQNINISLYESAKINGASWLQKHLYITLPLITPTLVFVIIVNIIESFRVFDIVHIMTQGGPANSTNVFVYYIYQQTFRYWDLGIGNALTTILVIVLFITIIFIMKSLR